MHLRSKDEAAQSTDEHHPRRSYPIRALQRGLLVLDVLLEARSPLNLEQLCARTGLPKATAFRIVLNLLQGQYLIETEAGYWLGLKLLRFGALVEEKLDLKRQAEPFLRRLLDLSNETVHLAVLDDDLRVTYLEKLVPQRAVGVMMSRIGLTLPMHCTGLGKAMAAFRPEDEIRRHIRAHGLERYTGTTITEEGDFLREMRDTRSRGYAIDNGEHEESVRCIAAPIRDKQGTMIAAISVAGPNTRMPESLVDNTIAAKVVENAGHISRALGCPDEYAVSTSSAYRVKEDVP